ncbi:hypothetical protein QA995_42630 [Streptomyces scabiei]|uniref:hypothetical protein n=1 Tax=Streptomyces scabiei TaxID=1930 RepID=UPI002FF15B8F
MRELPRSLEASEGGEDPQEPEESGGSEESAGVPRTLRNWEGPDQPEIGEELAQSIESVEPEGPRQSVGPDEPADPDEAPDPGETEQTEHVNGPDAPSEEDGEDGSADAPKAGGGSEGEPAPMRRTLGKRHPEVASVITALGADDANRGKRLAGGTRDR